MQEFFLIILQNFLKRLYRLDRGNMKGKMGMKTKNIISDN
jgi:hypothetical protein